MTNGSNETMDRAAARGMSIARRTFVFLGALAFAGCATQRTQTAMRLPDAAFPPMPGPDPDDTPAGAICKPPKQDPVTGTVTRGEVCYGGPVPFAIPRSAWAHGTPDVGDMEKMLPAKFITVHHDGMTPFWGTTELESKARLELIRTGHRGKGWADIGYHYICDRAGRVWQGRDVTKWQGAHVKYRNEGNIGVMCLGNFCEQKPSDAQLDALNRVIVQLRGYYRIGPAAVYTHREWPGAATVCPGDNLQAKVLTMRRAGFSRMAMA